jgi:hypothetical protein
MQLEKKYPGYASKYNLVTFCEDTPYSVAYEKGHAQDEWLLQYCDKNDTSEMTEEQLEEVAKKLDAV